MKIKSRFAALFFTLFLILGLFTPPAQAVSVSYNIHYVTTGSCTAKIYQTDFYTVHIQAWSGKCGSFRIDSYGYYGNHIVNSSYSYSSGMPIGTTVHSYNGEGQCYEEYTVYPSAYGYGGGWRLISSNNYFVRLW